jgi:hypothetical protein
VNKRPGGTPCIARKINYLSCRSAFGVRVDLQSGVLASADVRFSELNLVSRIDGMRWNIETARKAIGYFPLDHWSPIETEDMKLKASSSDVARQRW